MNVGLLGFGTVGSSFYDLTRAEDKGVKVTKILSRRVLTDVSCAVTADIEDIVSDPGIDTVVELIGGLTPAYDHVCRAIKTGKNVVTANKHLIAERTAELYALSEKYDVSLKFTAASGGGIPWLTSLSRASSAENILSLGGIMNGTSNYILSKMYSDNLPFDEALKDAQSRGLAEADPSADVYGLDACRKLALSSTVAFEKIFDTKDVLTYGIQDIKANDTFKADSYGYKIKHYAYCERRGDAFTSFVCPALFPFSSAEASVSGVNNVFSYKPYGSGFFSLSGPGAGGRATALNVLADCIDISRKKERFYGKTLSGKAHTDNGRKSFKWLIRRGEKYDTFNASPASAFNEYEKNQKDKQGALLALICERDEYDD
ncbi:MAG: homoserine dehydrogenase [Clostridia bacterium]|nr:homoserine dehydrogenase [Clostridia bacterium]